MAQRCAVSAGQRYIKTYDLTHDRTEWEVVDVKVVGAALPHALLVNCRDPSDTRTVSCAELTEGGAFALSGVAGAGDDRPIRGHSGRFAPGRRLEEGSARMGRLLRKITLAVRRYNRSWSRAPLPVEAAPAAAREHRPAN
jgi:hypothetical protein